MSTSQSTIAVIYDYDQTLSPNYMQDEVIFPHFGIDPKKFWKRCHELVQSQGFDSELAYLKTLLDCLEMDRPSNQQLRELGAGLKFFPGLPEMFKEIGPNLFPAKFAHHDIRIEHYIISSGLKSLIEGSAIAPAIVESCPPRRPNHFPQTRHLPHPKNPVPFPHQ